MLTVTNPWTASRPFKDIPAECLVNGRIADYCNFTAGTLACSRPGHADQDLLRAVDPAVSDLVAELPQGMARPDQDIEGHGARLGSACGGNPVFVDVRAAVPSARRPRRPGLGPRRLVVMRHLQQRDDPPAQPELAADLAQVGRNRAMVQRGDTHSPPTGPAFGRRQHDRGELQGRAILDPHLACSVEHAQGSLDERPACAAYTKVSVHATSLPWETGTDPIGRRALLA